MKRFTSILLVDDPPTESEAAFGRAVRLAQANKAKLTVVSVQRELDRNLPNLQAAIIRAQEKRLRELTSRLETKDVSIKTKSLIGIPFIEIVREIVSESHDLLIKPAEGRGGLGRLLFGSTDWQLMRTCPCPVWIIKPSKQERFSRVLAAVDPDPSIPENEELNRLILDLASSLARQDDAELHIVHAWSVPMEEQIRTGQIHMSPADLEQLTQQEKADHKERLSELVASHDLPDATTKIHLLKGDPSKIIPTVAKKSRAQLVLMGTVARTGIPGFFIGNTAEKTLGRLDCSVLTVKPKSFATPVQG